jgi:hypothetical protein
MFKKSSLHVTSERVILAPEGFVDEGMSPALRSKEIRIIEIRNLAEGPMFFRLHRGQVNS